ncbi:hypothetical protein KKC44_05035 [Patescibacteria group bacterium]|nr:hypothetical protein [Patescibacteria group bacterium]MBU2259939.1 hypothetical protein [Patescibacteria group bacterium]
MKFIFFFIFVGLFVWVALVPPEGMSKYPAVNVQFEYDKVSGEARVHVDKISFEEEGGADIDE